MQNNSYQGPNYRGPSRQSQPFSNYLSVTNVLIAICVLVFFVNSQTGQLNGELYFWQNPNFRPWQLVTHMFMHGSLNHLLFNMFGLWMFGNTLEKVWGSQRFLIFYLACGVGAAVIYLLINNYEFNALLPDFMSQIATVGMNSEEGMQMLEQRRYIPNIPVTQEAVQLFATPMVGASGAIYGILVAFAMLFPNSKLALIFLPVPVAAKYFVPALLGLDLFSGVTGFSLFGGNVAHFAHIGGAIIGALLTYFWFQQAKQKRQQAIQYGMWRE